ETGGVVAVIAVVHRRQHRGHVEDTGSSQTGHAIPAGHDVDAALSGAVNGGVETNVAHRKEREGASDGAGAILVPLDLIPGGLGGGIEAAHRDVARLGTSDIGGNDHVGSGVELPG